MEGLLQLLLYGFIYWLIMGRRKKKKRPGAAPDQQAKPAAPRAPAMEPAMERARQRPASSPPDRRMQTVPPIDEEAGYDPFEELRGALMQEGRAEEQGLRPSRDRSPDLRGRLESMQGEREESRRRELAEERRAEQAERERPTLAEVVSFDVPVVLPERAEPAPLSKSRTVKRESRRRSVLRNLRDPRGLKAAIILTEVLGPPLAKRGRRNDSRSR